jgi:oxygen-independent coproporphyrinogen-3 oxidase
VKRATETARKAGFSSVNFDLVYGLPRQNADRLIRSIWSSLSLLPDRIAFYSYAHTPWINCAQRLIDEKDLPSASDKLDLYLKGRELLIGQGYTDIGMDHFALPTDELYTAWEDGTLHRNFMGYTARKTSLLLGLGVSSISDIGFAFAQNDKTPAGYYRAITSRQLAVKKGYFLTEEDRLFQNHILDITCRGRTFFAESTLPLLEEYTLPVLRELEKDGLVRLFEKGVEVTVTGRSFIRNISKAFDWHLLHDESTRTHGETSVLCGKSAILQRPAGKLFSNSI